VDHATHAAHVAATAREIDDLVAALAAGPLSDPVPTCPDWTAADLAVHVAWFATRWRDHLRGGDYEDAVRPGDVVAPDGGDDATVAWLSQVTGELLAELRAAPPDARVWTWYPPDQTAGFVARRCAHELAIHRYDAQSVRGTCAPIAPEQAVDGIDEMLDVLSLFAYAKGVGAGQTVHVHGTDDPAALGGATAEWFIRLEPERPVVTREHAKGDLALRGGVSDLELLLYGRPPLGEIKRFGDESLVDVWHQIYKF
jgi:uncharacterized protein (TIGR03083 family)